ncbi:hypothetical protein GCM10023144_45470 [Pigmentiphaga soli]|uniref:Uncharacterized protein n=1 Tax=Pigmentiphaga soli TaxID=1007095 RepID=A0ABP8HR04_9BURK
MEDWKRQATGWVDERNFEIDVAQVPDGYLMRVRVIGFPLLQDDKIYASAAEAQAAAVDFLQAQFPGTVTLGE